MPVSYNDTVKAPGQEQEYTPDMIRELALCQKNRLHFIKEHIKIVTGDYGVVKFGNYMYPFQEHLINDFINYRFTVNLCGRQQGKTVVVGAFALSYAMFESHKTIGIVSNKEASAKSFLARIKYMYEQIPSHLKPGVTKWAEKSVKFDNQCQIMISATSKDSFRSESINLLICDELGFVDPPWKAEEFWKSNYPTISASVTSKIIIISTPNGMFNLFHRLYVGAETGSNTFHRNLYDWRSVPARDDEWAKQEKQNLGKVQFNQEYDCKFLGSSNTIIDAEVLEILPNFCEDPIVYDLNDKLRIYEKPIDGSKYVIGCLPIGEKVTTNNGIKNVQDVTSTDMLYDQYGEPTDIKNIQLYKSVIEKTYTIKPYATLRSTTFTGEHPLLISQSPVMKRVHGGDRYRDFDFTMINAKDVREDDWLKFPNIYKDKIISDDVLNKKWSCYQDTTRQDFIMNSPLHDKDFWWFVGIWLGDGWIQNHNNSWSIHTCHNAKTEQHFAIKIKDIFKKYGRNVNIIDKNRPTIDTVFTSKQLFNFLIDNFNKGAGNKTLPEWVKMLPLEYKTQLIKGYIDSDGSLVNGKSFNIVSISLNLLEGIQDICYSIGVLSSITKLRDAKKAVICNGNVSNCKETYYISFDTYDSYHLAKLIKYDYSHIIKKQRNKRYQYFDKDKNFIYIRIHKITINDYIGDVYNFETNDHTFLSRNITTHNSDIAKGTGQHYSVSQILKIISTNPLKLEQVAVFQDNHTDVYNFSSIIHKLCFYYNNAYLMVENNADGAAVVSQLWWVLENEMLMNSGGKEKDLGIRATKATKPKAVLFMKKLIEDGNLLLKDMNTVTELNDFIDKGNSRYGANNYDDDTVSALYWASYLFLMDMVDDVDFMKGKSQIDEDGWGILGDVEETYIDEDWDVVM